jgi:hypothetical protein
VNETVSLPAARTPKLRRAVRDAKKAGHALCRPRRHPDPVDRVAADGDILWVSGALPGARSASCSPSRRRNCSPTETFELALTMIRDVGDPIGRHILHGIGVTQPRQGNYESE